MKKTTLLKPMLLLCALIAGGSSAWAQDIESPWEHTFSTTEKTFTADGTETLSGVDWTLAVNWVNNSNKDYNKDEDKGMKIGSNSKAPNSMTLSTSGIPGTITKVSVTTCGRSKSTCTVSVTVGETEYTTEQSWGASTSTKMEFTGSESGDIVVSWDQSSSSNKGAIYVTKLTVEFEEDSGDTRETATWTLNPTSATVTAGESTTIELATNYDKDLSFDSDDTDIATASYNPSTHIITINGLAAGTTTINVTGSGSATYKDINKSIEVKVKAAIPAGVIFYEGMSGYTGSGDSNTVLTSTSSYLDSDDWSSFDRVYPGKVLSGDEDGHMKFGTSDYAGTATTKTLALTGTGKLTYKVQRYDSKETGELTVSVTGATATGHTNVTGTDAWVEKTVYLTNANGSIVITFATSSSNKRIRLDDITLTHIERVSVTDAGFATYATDNALDYSDVEGLTAYSASVAGNKVSFSPEGKVPGGAKSGVLIKAEKGVYDVPVIASADPIVNNFVRGTGAAVASKTGDLYNYILNKVGGVVGFYAAADNFVATNRAYLQTDTNEARISLDLDDEGTTAIEAVKTATAENGVFYNLAGQRVAQPTKGLYIVNGKKYIVK